MTGVYTCYYYYYLIIQADAFYMSLPLLLKKEIFVTLGGWRECWAGKNGKKESNKRAVGQILAASGGILLCSDSPTSFQYRLSMKVEGHLRNLAASQAL